MRAVARARGLPKQLNSRQRWSQPQALVRVAELHEASRSPLAGALSESHYHNFADSPVRHGLVDEYPFATRGVATSADASTSGDRSAIDLECNTGVAVIC